jgi:hypothetical protein
LRASPFVDPDRELIGVVAKNAHRRGFETFAFASQRAPSRRRRWKRRDFAPLPHICMLHQRRVALRLVS